MGLLETFLLLVSFYYIECSMNDNFPIVHLEANKEQLVDLQPWSITVFNLSSIHKGITYVIFHVHSQSRNLTVSSRLNFEPELTTSPGNDRGVVTVLRTFQSEAVWYVNSSSGRNVSVIAMANTFSAQDPLSGGCNQEFNMENNANIHLSYDAHNTLLQFQFSNVGVSRGSEPIDCENDISWKNLTYDLYLYYLQENNLSEKMFFSAMQKMLTLDSVLAHGTKIFPSFLRKKHHSNFTVASYLGRGAIYTVVVTFMGKDMVTRSMYIPSSTYACEFEGKVDNCEARHNVAAWILCTFAGIVGMFICFAGHRYFRTVMFLWGFSSFMLTFFIVFTLFTELSFTWRMIVAASFGLVGGGLWVTFWWFVGQPVFSVLLAGLNLGYLFASIVFFTPFGNMEVWKNDFNYGITFTCGVLVIPVIFLYFTKLLSILSCTVIGSYGFAIAINSYIHGSLSYIVVNSVKRAVNEDFNRSIMVAPFQLSEILLCAVWGALAIAGTSFQLYRERNNADFPDCPYRVHQINRQRHVSAIKRSERAPLLVSADQAVGRRSHYGTDTQPEVM